MAPKKPHKSTDLQMDFFSSKSSNNQENRDMPKVKKAQSNKNSSTLKEEKPLDSTIKLASILSNFQPKSNSISDAKPKVKAKINPLDPEYISKNSSSLNNEVVDQEPELVPEKKLVYSVTEFTSKLRDQLKSTYSKIMIQGELADYKGVHRSGHLYVSLKDAKSQIRLVMWKANVQRLPFKLEPGLEVIITGKVDFYPGSGSLQIVAESMEPVGIGALQLKFEQLKKKLKAEGLFDEEVKKPIPTECKNVAIVTGKSTAAFQDMLKVFSQRDPGIKIKLFHSAVQGERAPEQIIKAFDNVSEYNKVSKTKFDLVIVGRGGGSYEDLFCFNDEMLARKIAGFELPVITAIGHEIDFTIADFVSDKRAATPTHAAQLASRDMAFVKDSLNQNAKTLRRIVQELINDYYQKLDFSVGQLMILSPIKKIKTQKESLLQSMNHLKSLINNSLKQFKQSITSSESLLVALSPENVLKRGFSIVKIGEKVVSKSKDLKSNDQITVKFIDGTVDAKVN